MIELKRQRESSQRTVKAAELVARLYSGEMTEAEEQAALQWLSEKEENQREFDAVHELWDECGENRQLVTQEFADNRADHSGGSARANRRSHNYLIAASVLIVIGVAAMLSWRPTTQPSLSTYQTQVGEQQLVSLPDGSLLHLNTDSRVLVDFTDDGRTVYLERGQALFTVSKAEGRPFTVFTGKQSVTVLGTLFEVYRSDKKISVAVIEGRVAIHEVDNLHPPKIKRSSSTQLAPGVWQDSRSGAYEIGAGNVATFFAGTAVADIEEIDDADRLLSWRSGSIVFDDTPLFEVVAELNRYATTKVLIEDLTIADLPISGVCFFNKQDSFLNGIEQAHPIRIVRHIDRVVLVGEDHTD